MYLCFQLDSLFCFLDQKESISIDRFMRETADRWKNVSMELRCVQSMLEEVIAYWRRWNTLSEELEKWLNIAETKLQLPEEERMEFFQVSYLSISQTQIVCVCFTLVSKVLNSDQNILKS